MGYDRYDTRDTPRDDRSRWSEDRPSSRDWRGEDRGGRDQRGFFERAGDEISSWFGDEDAERRRREDQLRDERERGGTSGHDYNRSSRNDLSRSRDAREGFRERDRGYRPMAGDYGRSEQFSAASGVGRPEPTSDYGRFERLQAPPDRSRDHDPHYRSWRERHLSELDRDYDDYRRENQSKFESDFTSWRERRMQKRGLLGQIREQMEVVGNDDTHVGTVDKVAGDRIILAKSDPDSGGVHHSLSCSDIDRVDGDRVILDCSADQARQRWRDESRSRALFEREDQGEMGPRILDRSFEGTYR
jgi:hypothetical protein